MSEFWAAMAGAVAGGAATFYATMWQTKRVLSHERQMAKDAAEEQRSAVRQQIDREAARELFAPLLELEHVVGLITLGGAGTQGTYGAERAVDEMNKLRSLQLSTVSILSRSEARKAWAQLQHLVSELAGARSYTSSGSATRKEGWTEENLARAGADVQAFIHYVRAHLLSVVEGSQPPPAVETLPVLRRQDMSTWRPPGVSVSLPDPFG